MISKLKSMLLGNNAYAATAEDPEGRKQLALAALLVEMARADFDEQHIEHSEIIRLLENYFKLSPSEVDALINRAQSVSAKAVSLFDFTRALHESLNDDEKCDVIRMLWQVGNADKKIDKHEDYLVHKIADLLHVSHSDVIRLKTEVAD